MKEKGKEKERKMMKSSISMSSDVCLDLSVSCPVSLRLWFEVELPCEVTLVKTILVLMGIPLLYDVHP
jgi:hypothetical protein